MRTSPSRPETGALEFLRSLNLAGAGHPAAGPSVHMPTVLRDLTMRMRWSTYAIWMHESPHERLRCTTAWAGDRDGLRWDVGTVLASTEGAPGRALRDGVCIVGYSGTAEQAVIAVAVEVVGVPEAVVTFGLPAPVALVPPDLLEIIGESGPGAFAHLFLGYRRTIDPEPLDTREQEVLQLAAEGFSTDDISRLLGIQVVATTGHFAQIYLKLGVSDRVSAVAQGFRRGLVR